jgi:hypothetical protein
MTAVLRPDDVFTVEQYRYRRFMFGTDQGYARRYNNPMPADPGTPWAFSLPAVISATPVAREPIAAHLSFGDLVNVPDYGTYRIERDHNDNVKFIKA